MGISNSFCRCWRTSLRPVLLPKSDSIRLLSMSLSFFHSELCCCVQNINFLLSLHLHQYEIDWAYNTNTNKMRILCSKENPKKAQSHNIFGYIKFCASRRKCERYTPKKSSHARRVEWPTYSSKNIFRVYVWEESFSYFVRALLFLGERWWWNGTRAMKKRKNLMMW